MDLGKRALAAFGKIGIVIAIAAAFIFGLTGTVYLSLRSHEVKVPDIVGKDRFAAEETLQDAGLNIRVRAARPVSDANPDTIILQTPRAGEIVKVGQTIAVDVSRAAKEGESTITIGSLAKQSLEEGKQAADKADKKEAEDKGEAASAAKNENANANANENKPKKPRNSNNANNRNANNSNANSVNAANSATNSNAGTNSNRNLNNRNQSTPGNRNANGNANRNSNTLNINRRAPAVTTPPFVSPGARTP